MPALYRKYRPQTFSELVGQDHIKTTLQNQVASDRVAHAYLFSGPRGTGKTTAARILAKAANCKNRTSRASEPCNQCNSCQEITAGHSLDVAEIDAASHTGVDNVRENIIEGARFAPFKSKFKVFVIDEAHMLSVSAFNALLKTLEEPPAYVIFILATTEIHKLPATVISRCQRFDFRRISNDILVNRLKYIAKKEGVEIEECIWESIVRQSEGCLRDAESLLGQILILGDKKVSREQAELIIPQSNFLLVAEFIKHLLTKDAKRALSLISRLNEDGVEINQFTDDLIEFLRKLMVARLSGEFKEFDFYFASLNMNMAGDLNDKPQLEKLLKGAPVKDLVFMTELFLKKKRDIRSSPVLELPLELAVALLCSQDEPRTN